MTVQQNQEPLSMVERVANAMESASFGYSMNLVRLVDGVSTYSLKYSDGEYLEFSSTDEAYEHVAEKKRLTQARAAMEAMREPTEGMKKAWLLDTDDWVNEKIEDPDHPYKVMINAALEEKP